MPSYIARFDRGPSERFEAVNDAAALEYVREYLHDTGADEGDSGYVFLIDEGGRGDEEHVGDVTIGEDEDEDDGHAGGYPGCPGYPGPCPEGMDWSRWLAMNNVD